MNLTETVNTIRGALLAPQETWAAYLAKSYDWKQTALVLTLPLIIIGVIFQLLVAVFDGYISLVIVINTIVFMAISIAVFTAVLAAFSGSFGGTTNFDRALAALSLTMVPSIIAGVLANLLAIIIGSTALSTLIALAGFIYSLVLLYQIIPSYLDVPEDKRPIHFVVVIIAGLIVLFIIGGLFRITVL